MSHANIRIDLLCAEFVAVTILLCTAYHNVGIFLKNQKLARCLLLS